RWPRRLRRSSRPHRRNPWPDRIAAQQAPTCGRRPNGPQRAGPRSTWTMRLLLAATQEGFAAAARRLAAEQGVWTWPQAMITPDPGVQRVELYVGDATRGLPPHRFRDIVTTLTAS